MPRTTIVEISPLEQARRLSELRRARYGYLLALHLLLLAAAGRTPSASAAVLFCSRSSVYRMLDMRTGAILHRVWWRKTHGRFLDLLQALDQAYPPECFTPLYVVVDNYKLHKAQAVERWLAAHPRFAVLFLPTYCPKASPIERAFGAVHDKCTRNHKRKRLRSVVKDVKQHLQLNGPWPYALSELYYTPEVTAAVEALQAAETAHRESSQLAA